MSRFRHSVLAVCVVVSGAVAAGGAHAQQANDPDSKWTLTPLVPPVIILPPRSQLNQGTLGNQQNPYGSTPLQNPAQQSQSQQAPAIRLTIPTR